MDLRTTLNHFLIWLIYPLWLLAGFFDYLFHRRTRIEHTSGPTESWLHLAQFVSLAIPLFLLTFFEVTSLVIWLVAAAVLLHTVLSVADVSYTDGRRYISPLEQHVHGFMSVLPVIAVGIIAVLNWTEILNSGWALRPKAVPVSPGRGALLVGSYVILAGTPIVEELIRTSRGFRHHQVENDDESEESHRAEQDPES